MMETMIPPQAGMRLRSKKKEAMKKKGQAMKTSRQLSYDHAKQYGNDGACHNKRNGGKLHGNISRNGYGNAIIGSYGGCFEEGIWWVYGTGESCAAQERLTMVEG